MVTLPKGYYLKRNAIDFAKRKVAVTYLVSDSDDGSILGYFTLANKAIRIRHDAIGSKTLKTRIERFSSYDKEDGYNVPVYLLAQLGKNYSVDGGKRINISVLMQLVFTVTDEIQHLIGGALVYLDVDRENKKLKEKYEDLCGFSPFGERNSIKDGKCYTMMIRYISGSGSRKV